ncbi:MAG: ABC transporter permease [Paramuribaculum sp.]|nr:ABC transporter permease [Paramuribaculum sp.]
MFDLFREIAQTLRNNKVRTALTGFAVSWGIFMLIVLLGMSRGVFNAFTSFASLESSSVINVYPGYTTLPHKGLKEGRRIRLKESDREFIQDNAGSKVKSVIATMVMDSSKVSTSRDYLGGNVYGHFPGEDRRAKLKIISGRFLNQPDIDQKRKVIVLEEKNARLLFGDEMKAVGGRVDAFGLSWLVVGVYHHDWESGSYIPFTTAMALQGRDGYVSELKVNIQNVEDKEQGTEVEQSVKKALATTHEFNPDDRGGVYLWNRFNNYLSQLEAHSILSMAVWIIGLLTMLSGIVGVSNIMFVSVRERTHEIGIRRAIGAKPRSIWLQIVTESVAITTLFGYIGIVFGTLLTAVIDAIFGDSQFLKDPTVNISIAIQVTIVLIFAGAIAGLFPAIKATHVKPVEALRDE